MQIDTTIELRGSVYHVEINVAKLTLREQELVQQFGGPLIETGGTISATVTRPGSNTSARASGAAPIPVGEPSFLVSFGGELALAPTQIQLTVIAPSGVGLVEVVTANAANVTTLGFTANLSGGVSSAGYLLSWNVMGAAPEPQVNQPVAVNFSLPSAPRRLPNEFPVKYAVSLDDDEEADLKAAAYKMAIEQRIAAAKLTLLTKVPSFAGETRITL